MSCDNQMISCDMACPQLSAGQWTEIFHLGLKNSSRKRCGGVTSTVPSLNIPPAPQRFNVEVAPSERALLAYLLAKIHRVDPDLLVVCHLLDCMIPCVSEFPAGPQPDSLPPTSIAEQIGCL